MNIVLIGYRGSGKSQVGRAFAQRKGMQFVDTDQMIQERAGHSIRHIFETQGEAKFRVHEARAVQAACLSHRAVISVGGGAVMNPDNARAIKDAGRVIWLRCSAESLWQRVGGDVRTVEQRPDLTTFGGLAEIKHMLEKRAPVYQALADHIVDTDQLAVDQVVEDIERFLKS